MNQTYTMTQEQYDKIIKASQPVIAIWVGGPPCSPLENANAAWAILGDELGFDYLTVRPVVGNKMQFTAQSK